VFGWLRRRRQEEREAEARSLAIAKEMDRRDAEMRRAGPVLASRHIPAAKAGRPVTVSLNAGDDGAFVIEMDMGPGQVGLHRGAPPIATTVSDSQHWALAGRREDAEEVEVTTERGEAVEVAYGDGVWMAIIDPFERDLPVEVRATGDGRKVRSRTITLPRFESPPIERGPWPFRTVRSVGSVSGWAWFDPEE
jgi:hypothetical protein